MHDPTRAGHRDVRIMEATADRFAEIAAVDARNFGLVYTADDIAASLEVIDVTRFRVALDGDSIVGLGGSYALPITLPGGAVSTSVTHRRRGVLHRLMEALHADGVQRHEPISGLTASEGGIYERFGYGVSTTITITEIDPRLTRVRDEFLPPPGSIHLASPGDAIDAMVERYARHLHRQARSYRVDDRLVLGIEGDSWAVSRDGCRRTDDPVDLDLAPSAVGPLLLGGVSASALARGRRLHPSGEGILGRADAFFGWDPLPHCRTAF